MDHQSQVQNDFLFKYFLNTVKKYPNRIAAYYISLKSYLSNRNLNESLTYEQLNNKINDFEIWLNNLNLKSGDYIYVLLDPSLMLIITILTCWKKKYVYIPIHQNYFEEAEHRKYIIIETNKLKDLNVEDYNIITCPFDSNFSFLISGSYNAREENYYPIDRYPFHYIMHTSGTTRKGKNGITVRVPEDALYWNVMDIINKIQLDKIPHYYGILMTAPSFDPSLIEIFTSILLGGTLFIPSTSLIKSTEYLYRYCLLANPLNNTNDTEKYSNKIKLTLMMTPSHLFSFQKNKIRNILEGKTNVNNLILGGEKFPSLTTLINIMKEEHSNSDIVIPSKLNISLWNIYGTTENSVWASLYKVEINDFLNSFKNENKINENDVSHNNQNNNNSIKENLHSFVINNVPLGTPLKNTTLLIRYEDGDDREKTIEIQEKHIQYNDNNKLFHEIKFNSKLSLPDTFDHNYWIVGELWIGGSRQCWIDLDDQNRCGEYVNTGDIVLFNKMTHKIYHYGRSNQQIKLSGYRIHLEQCNYAMEKIKSVNKCVTLLLKNKNIDELICFISYNDPINDSKEVVNQLKNQLKRWLPFYAIPNRIIILYEFPLNKNGKIDMKQLQQLYYEQINNNDNDDTIDLINFIHQHNKPKSLFFILKTIIKEIDPKYNGILKNADAKNINIEGKHYFFELGGNSLQATILAQKINNLINKHGNKEENYTKELSLYIMNYSLEELSTKVYEMLINQKLSNRNINEYENFDQKISFDNNDIIQNKKEFDENKKIYWIY